MLYCFIVLLISTLLISYSCRTGKVTAVYCGKQFIEEQVKVYLPEENLESNMVSVKDKKTKKFVFGYFKSAIRNDTNFIYSKISVIGDTIIRRVYRPFKITNGTDSVISTFICTNKGVLFHTNKNYWNGEVNKDTIMNVVMGQ